jgi:hypothetical protein
MPAEAAAAAAAAAEASNDIGECSYVASLLRHSTGEQVQQALSWSCDDWQQYWRVRINKKHNK